MPSISHACRWKHIHQGGTPTPAAACAAGLKKYSLAEALEYLLTSERHMMTPPECWTVTNRSMIGRIYLQQGDKKKARAWLLEAVHSEVPPALLDVTARDALLAAQKSLKSCGGPLLLPGDEEGDSGRFGSIVY